MEISEDARKMLEKKVTDILREMDIPEGDKRDIRGELLSNFTDASMAKAQARGASIVEKPDVESVLLRGESPEKIASEYMISYASSMARAGLLSRSIAYVIDLIVTTLLSIIVVLPFILIRIIFAPSESEPHSANFYLNYFIEVYYLLIILNLVVLFIYFVVCEGFFGFTPGKWLLGLKVLREDGRKASYKEAMLRTIPKLFIVAIIIDALLMVLYHGKDRQRMFDRIAGTIVIKK